MPAKENQRRLLRDQWVEVRSYREIALTLDAEGKLEELPFMPEMARYCGLRIRVARRADKTCVAGLGIRHMRGTVFLQDLRCDGAHHDGCQRACLLFWKEAWLKPLEDNSRPAMVAVPESDEVNRLPTRRGDAYLCQSTELHKATTPMSRWSVLPLLQEMRHGELSLLGFLDIIYRTVRTRLFKLPELGTVLGTQTRTHRGSLDLRPGELVEIKDTEQIRSALNAKGQNCGLTLTPSMSVFLGERHEVAFPVQKIIIESTGKMAKLSNTVALKGVTCSGPCVKNCPRSEYHYWRESWLERADAVPPTTPRS